MADLRPPPFSFLYSLLTLTLLIHSTSAVDFLFNGFDSSNLNLYGDTEINYRILALTNDSIGSIGRALHKTKIPTKSPGSASSILSFYTSFIFSISHLRNFQAGYGIVFIFAPLPGLLGAKTAQHLGLFNFTSDGDRRSHVLGVEFDLFQNPEFRDVDANHVGVDINSLTSVYAQPAGYWPDEKPNSFENLTLNNGVNYQVWVDYSDFHLNVTMAPAGVKKPERPLISGFLNLTDVFLDEMYVGFCSATGLQVESHRILAWSFSNTNRSAYEGLITSNLPSFVPTSSSAHKSTGLIAGITVGSFVIVCLVVGIYWFWVYRKTARQKEREETEDWELQYWPHRIAYQDILAGTNGFSEQNVIGVGGNGKVYQGVFAGDVKVAVKCISHENEDGMKEFLAEVSSLGRLKHRNLVALRGWCKREKGSLMLVYDFMENSSLDKWIFDGRDDWILDWETRFRVLKDVAAGVLYLHEGWEKRVLHRDIKASNVMLDKDMIGKLGDFGLARMHGRGQALSTTRVVGTVGYMAPEVVRTGKATAKTDVFGFGVLILEAVCGRRPVEDGKPLLVDWVLGLMEKGEVIKALDPRLRTQGGFDEEEEVERVLYLGLLCTYSDPMSRPSMRQVVKMLEGTVDVEDGDGEAMDAYLLTKLESTLVWSKHRTFEHRKHPTFKELRQSLSSSISISDSDSIMEGR